MTERFRLWGVIQMILYANCVSLLHEFMLLACYILKSNPFFQFHCVFLATRPVYISLCSTGILSDSIAFSIVTPNDSIISLI